MGESDVTFDVRGKADVTLDVSRNLGKQMFACGAHVPRFGPCIALVQEVPADATEALPTLDG